MLLICPNCSARYLLSSIALGEGGRDVRCVKCDHEWYQARDDLIPQDEIAKEVLDESLETEEEQVLEVDDLKTEAEGEEQEQEDFSEEAIDAHLDEDPIPEGVKPKQEGSVPALPEDVLRPKAGLQAKLTGYFAALMIFGMLMAGGFLFKQKIVSLWLPAAAIYDLAGVPVIFKGKKLTMESLSAKIQGTGEGQDLLLLEGRVINLTNEVQEVPQLLARLRSTNGEEGDSWNIETPLEKLEPGESFTFKSDYPAVPRGVGSVNLTFVPAVSL